MTKIAVFGAGTWGIALARLLAANGRDVTVWSAIPAELKSLSTTHRHPNLPGMELPAAMHYTADIAEACTGRDILLFAVPSPFVRATAKKAAPHIPEGQLIVDVAKGVEDKTLMTMSEIIEDELAKAGRKARVVALSGPDPRRGGRPRHAHRHRGRQCRRGRRQNRAEGLYHTDLPRLHQR